MFARWLLSLLLFACSFACADTSPPKKPPCEVLTLGAAVVDHFFFISDEQLKTITTEKESWAPIDYPSLCNILESNPDVSKMIPGGSGINVIKGIAHFGHSCRVVGKIGTDEKGDFFLRSMKSLGIDTHLQKGKLPTGQAICFITGDAQRTFRSYLGASHSLSDLEIDPSFFEGVKLFHIEGYQLLDRDLIERALKLAKEAGVEVSMDLANTEIVRRNRTFLLEILPKYVDILFCNESEAKELTGFSAKEACSNLASICKVAVVTMSERGSWTQEGKSIFYTPAFSVNAIDTTGAGDLYASGFLHGRLCNEPLQKCAWLGSLTASYVVKMIGAEIPDQIWEEIFQRARDEDPFIPK